MEGSFLGILSSSSERSPARGSSESHRQKGKQKEDCMSSSGKPALYCTGGVIDRRAVAALTPMQGARHLRAWGGGAPKGRVGQGRGSRESGPRARIPA